MILKGSHWTAFCFVYPSTENAMVPFIMVFKNCIRIFIAAELLFKNICPKKNSFIFCIAAVHLQKNVSIQ